MTITKVRIASKAPTPVGIETFMVRVPLSLVALATRLLVRYPAAGDLPAFGVVHRVRENQDAHSVGALFFPFRVLLETFIVGLIDL
ncbi:MAG TPA: hypothetical protein VNM48_07860 [Chloroflexota bacterium]|nr:hypothetical protein [Chloroflexota bacterium]